MPSQFQQHPSIVDDIFVRACNNQAVLSQCAARNIPEIQAELSQGFVSQEMFERLWTQHLQHPSEFNVLVQQDSMDIITFSSFLQEFHTVSASGRGSLKDCHLPLSKGDSHRKSESRPVLLPWEYLTDLTVHMRRHDAYVRRARAHHFFDTFRLLSKSERCQLLLVSKRYNCCLEKRYNCFVPWPVKGLGRYEYLRFPLDLSHAALMFLQDHLRRRCLRVFHCLRAHIRATLSLKERYKYCMCGFLRRVLEKWTLITWTPVIQTYTLEGSILHEKMPLHPKGKKKKIFLCKEICADQL